jgi:hypothetical protein
MVYNKQKIVLETKWGKFVHAYGEIGQFFLMLLIFPVFTTVLGVFRH